MSRVGAQQRPVPCANRTAIARVPVLQVQAVSPTTLRESLILQERIGCAVRSPNATLVLSRSSRLSRGHPAARRPPRVTERTTPVGMSIPVDENFHLRKWQGA